MTISPSPRRGWPRRAASSGWRTHNSCRTSAPGRTAREASINPGFGVPDTQTAGAGAIQISYDLDLFGRLADSSEAARSALLASQAAQDNVRLAVAASAASGYIALRALDARLLVLRDTLAARGEELRVARRRSDAGYSSQLDLAQAEAAYRATEQL